MREFKKFLRSSFKFITSTAQKGWFAIVILLVQSTNLYTEYFQSMVPSLLRERADNLMEIADEASFWLAIVLLVLAGLRTFHDINRQIRDPRITNQLKAFYADFDRLLGRNVANDTDLEGLKGAVNSNITEVVQWVEQNMDSVSLMRLTQERQSGFQNFTFRRKDAFNDEHSRLIDQMIGLQESLALLIEREAWV